MLETASVTELARELDQAERNRRQIPQFSLRYPDLTVADSYAIQRAWTGMKRAAG